MKISLKTYTDLDLDILQYDHTCPKYTSLLGAVQYSAGLSCAEPFPSDGATTFNSNLYSFQPNLVGRSATAFRISDIDPVTGVQKGWIEADIQIVVLNNCGNAPPIIGPIIESGAYSISMEQRGELCFHIPINELENEDITDASIELINLPGATSQLIGAGSIRLLKVCVNDPDFSCDAQLYSFKVLATDNGCPSPATSEKTFEINVEPGKYCKDTVYVTNANSNTGITVPAYLKASSMIYIGDNMPTTYIPGMSGPLLGPVEINYPAVFEAGFGVDIPACQTGVGCVDFQGNSIDIRIKPNNCSDQCPNTAIEILDMYARFDCYGENLIATVSGGQPPYTYDWVVNGVHLYQNFNSVNIHNVVSQIDGGKVFYSLTVYDAAGDYFTAGGPATYVYGTKRFYNDIHENALHYSGVCTLHQDDTEGPDSCRMFAANQAIFQTVGAEIFDDVNTDPPYYGATKYTLDVFDGYGNVIYRKSNDLETSLIFPPPANPVPIGSDWSLDNYEVFWNGVINNGPGDGLCAVQFFSSQNIFNYILRMENCGSSKYVEQDVFVIPVDPIAEGVDPSIIGCYPGNNSPNTVPAIVPFNKSYHTFTFGESGTTPSSNGVVDTKSNQYIAEIKVFPNPANENLSVSGLDYREKNQIIILDSKGKIVVEISDFQTNQINISTLVSGVYHVKIIKASGIFSTKFVKM